MNVTLRQLRYVLAAARERSLTAAAQSLHVSQPALSVAIGQIEAEAGQQLFVRNRGAGVTLTPFGRRFIEASREVLRKLDELEDVVSTRTVRGEFVLGCFEDLAPFCLAPILQHCAARYPELSITVCEAGFEQLASAIAAQEIDALIGYDLVLPDSVAKTALCEVRAAVVVGQGHRLATRDAVPLAELAHEHVLCTNQPSSWQHVLDLLRQHGAEPARISRIGSFELQRSMIAHGLGVGVIYTRPASDLSYDGLPLVHRPIAEPLIAQRIVFAAPGSTSGSAMVEAVRREAITWFANAAGINGGPNAA